jgi:hypothetical protein
MSSNFSRQTSKPRRFFKENRGGAASKPQYIPKKGNEVEGTVDFMDINLLKKNSVRGLLRKRAKKYEEDGDDLHEEASSYGGSSSYKRHGGSSGVLKNSFAAAFQSILSKQVAEDKADEPILAKYKRPAKEVSEEQRKENELKQKRLEKERIRLMGRHIPTGEDEEHEREL